MYVWRLWWVERREVKLRCNRQRILARPNSMVESFWSSPVDIVGDLVGRNGMRQLHHARVSWNPRGVQSSDLYNRVQTGPVNWQQTRQDGTR
jgi:hypothetical protein